MFWLCVVLQESLEHQRVEELIEKSLVILVFKLEVCNVNARREFVPRRRHFSGKFLV